MSGENPVPGKKLYSPELVAEAIELCYMTAYQLGFPEPTEEHLELFVTRCLRDWEENKADGQSEQSGSH
jgi:hypothetical protein